MKPLFFVHIPKTAGSSLHKSAIDIFGADRVERNNGNNGPQTTDLVRKFYYDSNKNDHFQFFQDFITKNKQWLTAHMHAQPLLPLFGATNTLSFVRDPIERIISNHRYMTKIGKNSLTFEEYYKHPNETNKQFRMIGQTVWQAFHLVGTVEDYSECLSLLSGSKSLDLTENHINTNPTKSIDGISEEIIADIRKWNERDCIFVEEVRQYLAKRLDAWRLGAPFCFHDMGFVPDTHIIGWAFYGESEAPVDIGLYVDGTKRETIRACELVDDLNKVQAPRKGHNGFRFVLEPYKDVSHIEVKALQTDQTLFSWTRPE